MLSLAAGSAHGTPLQEAIIVAGLRSVVVALIAALALIVWGLRTPALQRGSK
jgi:hypothetical protein